MIKGLSERYERECNQIGKLAKRQLNLEKNRVKEDFEDMSIEDIYDGLEEEMEEVESEVFVEKINLQRLEEEIGDVASFCVGAIAWINKQRQDLNDDGA